MIFHGKNLVTKLVVIENKISITTYFKNLIVELHAQYTYQIWCKIDIIYYMIYKLIFYE